MVEGAHNSYSAPIPLLYIFAPIGVMFHVKHWLKGYDSADSL